MELQKVSVAGKGIKQWITGPYSKLVFALNSFVLSLVPLINASKLSSQVIRVNRRQDLCLYQNLCQVLESEWDEC